MPMSAAADWPAEAPSCSTTMRSPVAIEPAATSAVTTAMRSTCAVWRSAPSTSENIAWTSDLRLPTASESARRCFATSKLLIGTIASVRMGEPATLTVQRRRVGERLLRDATARGCVVHERVGHAHRQAARWLVGHEALDHVAVRGGDAGGAPLEASVVHERVGRALDRAPAHERAYGDHGRRCHAQRVLHPRHGED